MEKLTSILVVANRTESDRMLLDKAIHLARNVGARICLFSCDAGLAKVLHHSYKTEEAEKAWNACLAEHLSYLRGLQAAARAPDVQISIDSACSHPSFAGIVRKAEEVRADLIMKCPAGAHPMRRVSFDSSDWRLMRASPCTLMLVRHREWHDPPRFAALVDLSVDESALLAEPIVHTSEYFTLGCRAELDLVYSESGGSPAEMQARTASLERLAHEYHIGTDHLHILSGEPELTLPEFVARHQYDAVVLGGLTHRKGVASLVGTLTSKLVDALECDFILVKRARRAVAEVELTGAEGRRGTDEARDAEEALRAPDAGSDRGTGQQSPDSRQAAARPGSSVLWQSLFGD